jgi:hypothetical protein
MKPLLLALVAAAALFLSTGTARAQPRGTSFNNSIIVSPSLIPSSFPQSTFTPSRFTSPYGGSGYSAGVGNYGTGYGNGYTYAPGIYNTGYYYPVQVNPGYYGGYSGNYYGGNNYGSYGMRYRRSGW